MDRRTLFKSAAASAVAAVVPEGVLPESPCLWFPEEHQSFDFEVVSMPIIAQARKLSVGWNGKLLEDGTLEMTWKDPASVLDDQPDKRAGTDSKSVGAIVM